MAAVDVVISGFLYHGKSGQGTPVTIVGIAAITDLQVGGGPIVPPPGGGTQPPPHPEHPIAGWPGSGFPDKPGYPPTAEHPIVLPPDEGTKPPDPVQPPVEWKAVWHPTEGWMVVGIPTVPHPTPS